jgi:outer membrane protein TolC
MKASQLKIISGTVALLVSIAPRASLAQTPAAQPAAVQGATQLSLDDAVRMAESQSEAVRIARAGLQRADGQKLQARSQYLPQVYGSAGYTRTLKSQYSGFAGSTDTVTAPAAPAPPCDDYLLGPDASVADRLAGLETSARCASGLNPFAAFSSLPFGQANQYQLGLSVSQNLFTGGRIAAQNAAAAAGRRSANRMFST